MTATTTILLAGRRIPLNELRADPARHRHLLLRAKTETGYAECLCRTPPLRLVIRERDKRFHLAVWPATGHQHAAACAFYRVDDAYSGRRFGGVTNRDGAIGVRLDRTLMLAAQSKPTTRAVTRPRRPAASPNTTAGPGRITLLGLLHLVWEEAGLNAWNPAARRDWDTLRDHLIDARAGINVDGVDLTTSCYIPPLRDGTGANTTRNRAKYRAWRPSIGDHGSTDRFGLILGEIGSIESATSTHGLRVNLKHLPGLLWGSAQLEAKLRNSYQRVFAAIDRNIGRQFALCWVAQRTPRYVTLLDMAPMVTNGKAIPVDSSYELTMADHIVAARRTLIKPLRYNRDDAVFPDFVLTDTDPHTYVEVYGMTHADYLARKQEKQRFYAQRPGSVIEWERGTPLPDLARRGAG